MRLWCCALSGFSCLISCLTVSMSRFVPFWLLCFHMCSLPLVVFCVQKGSALVSVVKVVLVVGILFTYPLQLVPVIQALETWMQSDSPFEPVSPSSASSSPGVSPRPAPPTDEELEEQGLGTVRGAFHAQTGGEYASCTFWASGALLRVGRTSERQARHSCVWHWQGLVSGHLTAWGSP